MLLQEEVVVCTWVLYRMVCSFLLDTQQYGRFAFFWILNNTVGFYSGGVGGWLQPAKQKEKKRQLTSTRGKKGGRKVKRNKTTKRNKITISILYHLPSP